MAHFSHEFWVKEPRHSETTLAKKRYTLVTSPSQHVPRGGENVNIFTVDFTLVHLQYTKTILNTFSHPNRIWQLNTFWGLLAKKRVFVFS